MKQFLDRIFSAEFWTEIAASVVRLIVLTLVGYGMNSALKNNSKV